MDYEQLKLSNQVCFPIYSVSRLITKAYKPHLDKLGITYPQYLVLLVLWEKDKMPVNEIGKKLLLNTNTLSPLLKRMEKLALIERIRSAEDERSVIVQLTQQGIQIKPMAAEIPEKLLSELTTDSISKEEILQLRTFMNSWIPVLERHCESYSNEE